MKHYNTISKEEMPYERCLKYGEKSLTDAELLAVILRSGTKDRNVMELANHLLYLKDKQSSLRGLMDLSFQELTAIKGIGNVKAMQILCIRELSKRFWRAGLNPHTTRFLSPDDVYQYYKEEMRYLGREEMRIVFLDTKQRLIGDSIISVGTVNSTAISAREILIASLKQGAVHIIMIHNHPSGDPNPSNSDFFITHTVRNGCVDIGIKLNDHIIIGDNSYYSFKERGTL